MLEYLVDKFIHGGHDVTPRRNDLLGKIDPRWSGTISNYLLLDPDTPAKGIVFLVDQAYTARTFRALRGSIRNTFSNNAFIFLKDGKTYFRNSAERHDYKRGNGLSLKKYTTDETHRMILFRPEERIVADANARRIQYYQPDSARLDEKVITYTFGPVTFDYSHAHHAAIDLKNADSERIFIWKKKDEIDGPITLRNGRIEHVATTAHAVQ